MRGSMRVLGLMLLILMLALGTATVGNAEPLKPCVVVASTAAGGSCQTQFKGPTSVQFIVKALQKPIRFYLITCGNLYGTYTCGTYHAGTAGGNRPTIGSVGIGKCAPYTGCKVKLVLDGKGIGTLTSPAIT